MAVWHSQSQLPQVTWSCHADVVVVEPLELVAMSLVVVSQVVAAVAQEGCIRCMRKDDHQEGDADDDDEEQHDTQQHSKEAAQSASLDHFAVAVAAAVEKAARCTDEAADEAAMALQHLDQPSNQSHSQMSIWKLRPVQGGLTFSSVDCWSIH